jgi:hypothetical protein
MKKTTNDIIVWDVDETLGSFATFSDIYNAIEYSSKNDLTYDDFRDILDMFPEYIRPKLLKYFRYLNKNKNGYKVVIYTNNMGGRQWIDYIKQYIEDKIKSKIFDDVIYAYSSDARRSSDNKTYGDLHRCLDVSNLRHVYFIDDQPHIIKNDKRVKYLQIPAYVIYPAAIDVGGRLLNSKIHKRHIKNFPVFLGLIKSIFESSMHFEGEVLYSKLDDKVLENFVHDFVRKTTPRNNNTRKSKRIGVN